ncbi:MAG: hypothetical protein AB4050_18215 [Synechococcus sp.]
MTHPPHDSSASRDSSDFKAERSLTDFLQSNAPAPPPADTALRSQILMEIANHPHSSPRRLQGWWLVPAAIAVAMLANWLWPRPSMLTADERLELEMYLISSWTVGTTIETDPLDDWLEDGDPDWFDEF